MTPADAARLGAMARATIARARSGEQLTLLPTTAKEGSVSGTDWLKWETYRVELARTYAPTSDAWDWRAWWNAGKRSLASIALRLKRHPRYTRAEW